MDTKHTDAPWHLSSIPGEYRQEHVVNDDGYCIATVHQPEPRAGRRDPREVLLANGSLIGRAPNMYIALKAIADMRTHDHANATELVALCITIAQIEVEKVERT